jgi:acetolactate synthase regulatory subunit
MSDENEEIIEDVIETRAKILCVMLIKNKDLMERILKLTNDVDFEYELPIQIQEIDTQIKALISLIKKSNRDNTTFFKRIKKLTHKTLLTNIPDSLIRHKYKELLNAE